MLTNNQIQRCKKKLEERQSEIISHVNNFGLSINLTEAADELSSYDNHPGDMGTALFERGKDIALKEHAEKELEEINLALHAIEEGTYGICTACGKDIPFERLLTVPTTDKCVEHGPDNAFDRERPIEEEVFSPNINPDEKTAETQVGYDAEDAWQEVSRYGSSDTPSDLYGDRDSYDEMFPNSDETVGEVDQIHQIIDTNVDKTYEGNNTDEYNENE